MPQVQRTLVDCPHCDLKQVWVRHVPYCMKNPNRRNTGAGLRTKVCARCKQAPKYSTTAYCKPCAAEAQRLNPKTREYARRSRRKRNEENRQLVIEIYGKQCACCGEKEEMFLALDHVDNDGAQDRGNGVTTDYIYRRVVDGSWRDRFQLLCWNCNRGRWVCGECPHVIRRRGDIPVIRFVTKQMKEPRTYNGAPSITKA